MRERSVFHVMPGGAGDWIWRTDDGGSRSFTTREEALADAIRRAEREPESQVLVRADDDSMTEIYRNITVHPVERSAVRARAQLYGHPLHPYLIPFPIGFLAAAPFCDVMYLATADAFWATLARYALMAGLASGLVAALVGLVDFVGLRAVRRTGLGWGHLLLNLAVMALAFANIVLRLGERVVNVAPAGVTLSFVTVLFVVASAWLGGTMTYERRIGVVPREAA